MSMQRTHKQDSTRLRIDTKNSATHSTIASMWRLLVWILKPDRGLDAFPQKRYYRRHLKVMYLLFINCVLALILFHSQQCFVNYENG